MFDIGLFELVLVAVISLLVLGPERLPEAIRTAALHIGRLKRLYRSVRTDLEREIGADEIRRQLHNEEIMQSLESSQQELNNIAADINPNNIANDLKKDIANITTSPDTTSDSKASHTPAGIETPKDNEH